MADIRKLIAVSALFHAALFAAMSGVLPRAVPSLQELTPVELVEVPKTTEPQRAAPAPVKPWPIIEKKIEPEAVRPLPETEPEAVQAIREEIIKAALEAPAAAEKKETPAPTPAAEKPVVPAVAQQPVSAKAASIDERAALSRYVNEKVDRAKRYPNWAKQRGYEGVVGLSFSVMTDGSVRALAVTKPCASDILNKAALEAVERAAPFDKGPFKIDINLRFKLDE